MRTVVLFVPCFVDLFWPQAGEAAITLLERAGCRVRFAEAAACCGQPALTGGHPDAARDVARAAARALAQAASEPGAPASAIVTPSGTCAAMLAHEFAPLGITLDLPVFELGDFLVRELGVTDLGARFKGKVALHTSCHTQRALEGAAASARVLLEHVRDLELVETNPQASCCGFGGLFATEQPELSVALGRERLSAARDARVDVLVSTDVSCLLHLVGLTRDAAPRLDHLACFLAAAVVR